MSEIPDNYSEMISMSPEERRGFLEGRWLCKIATVKADGTPLVAPVWYEYTDGCFQISTFKESYKVRAIRHQPRVALCIDTDVPLYKCILVRGDTTIIEDEEEALEVTERIYTRYLGPRKGPLHLDEVLELAEGTICLIRVDPDSWTSWNYEKDTVYVHR
jgi:PPOX class probable F420-dependent enzyme